MFRVNEFARMSVEEGYTDQELWALIQNYKALSKKAKRKMARRFVKHKQSLNFNEWWAYIQQRVQAGHRIHEANQDNYFESEEIKQMSKQVHDPKFLKYIGQDKRIK